MARQIEAAFREERVRPDEPAVVRRQERALAAFGRRVEGGDFGELFDERLRAGLAESAAERKLAVEIGALRVVMGRLLSEPGLDASAQARGVARVVEMIVRATRAQGSWRRGRGSRHGRRCGGCWEHWRRCCQITADEEDEWDVGLKSRTATW